MNNVIKHFIKYSLRHFPLLIGLTLINLFIAPNHLWVLWVALFTFIGFFNEVSFTGKNKTSKHRDNDTW